MTPTELHAWVRDRWQEKLDIARAATEGPWYARIVDMGVRLHVGTPLGQSAYAFVVQHERGIILERHNGGTVEDAIHAAAFDPTFAIAVCEAALERVDRHRPLRYDGAHVCRWCTDGEANLWWPCPDLLSDAAPFRTRPDYPEELNR